MSIEPFFADATGVEAAPEGFGEPSLADVVLTLRSVSSGSSHTWMSFNDFDSRESYQSGDYVVGATLDMGEGFELGTEVDVVTVPGAHTPVNLVLTPSVSMFEFAAEGEPTSYSVVSTGVHAVGTREFTEGQRVFVSPSLCCIYICIESRSGRRVNVVFDRAVYAERARLYTVCVTATDDRIFLTVDGEEFADVAVSRDIFDTEVPSVLPVGFEPGAAVTATEGVTLGHPVAMEVKSGVDLAHVYLSVESPILDMMGHSAEGVEVDLLNMTQDQYEAVAGSGIGFDIAADRCSATVTFTLMIEELASLTSARSVFNLSAVDILGRLSEPVSLIVDTRTIGFDVIGVTPLVVGENTCTVTMRPSLGGVEQSDMRFFTVRNGVRVDCPIIRTASNVDGTVDITFSVSEAGASTTVHFEYMGLERATFVVLMAMPSFSVTANPYATYVRLHISAENAEATARLTSALLFFDGDRRCSVLERDTQNGIIVVNGLVPDTRYTLVPALEVDEPLGSVVFTTERALDVPDGDFEDAKPSMLKYDNLPSGGRYAVTPFDIANRQNYVDIDIPWSQKYWSSVNAKTFCTSALNRNTWYMQPSTAIVHDAKSGSKAMCLTSVGWDLDGEDIADYVPTTSSPVPTYSLTVPNVRFRSAGRLFIGDYRFNASSSVETYSTGTPFTSRPTALNGFYKYTADQTVQNDRGGVHVRLVARAGSSETVVAEGRGEFVPMPDYTAFNVPLEYRHDNLRPTHLEIMFVSSTLAGEVSVSDDAVPVTAAPDCAAMRGSILWIDNLSFAY